MEYSLKGEAPYILCLNGTPHTHDGLLGCFDKWFHKGFGVIAPSRPGYGNTPFELGNKYADSAVCFAALLDTLKIDQVVVFGISGGGPAAIHFAAKYPDRTKALLIECAVTGDFKHPEVEDMDN